MPARFPLALIMLLTAVPAHASGATAVPEGSSLSLLALGVLGVIIGRRASMRHPDQD